MVVCVEFRRFSAGGGPVMFSRCLGSALASGRGRPFSVDSVACFCLSALGPESDRSCAETDGARFKNGCDLVRVHLEPETGHLLDGGGPFQDPDPLWVLKRSVLLQQMPRFRFQMGANRIAPFRVPEFGC